MKLQLIALSIVLTGTAVKAQSEQTKSIAEQTIMTLDTLSGGPHAGLRANHAKGVLVTGSFQPSAEAASISKAPHFRQSVPVTVRFSTGTGVPTIPDANPNSRPYGMAIRFTLPEGGFTDLVGISYDGFPVSTPEDFLSLLKAVASIGKSTEKPAAIERFLSSHPAALAFVQAPKPAPVSFGSQSYFGVNAFEFTNAGGTQRFGRYRIMPFDGNQFISDDDAARRSDNYLMDELPARLAQAEVRFKVMLQLAEKTDVTDNASVVWPKERAVIELGTLTLSQALAKGKQAEKTLAFNPLILPEGIAPSADPILLSRPIAYAISAGRRN